MSGAKKTDPDADAIRRNVSETYAKAVTKDCGCCSDGTRTPTCEAAEAIGYAAEELGDLPADAVEHSYGCGNPLAFSEVRAGQTVLDLGSGAGIDLLIAAGKVGPTGRVIGVDMTDEMIARARANVAEAGLTNVEVRKGIIEQLPVEDASVDWVISNCVINLSPDKERVFADIARVLKPGGRMRVSDIVVSDLPQWVRDSSPLHSACVAGAITEEEYIAGLRAAGLVDVEVLNRHVYDASQLESFVITEPASAEQAGACCGSSDPNSFKQICKELAGKIQSDLFTACKPAR